MRKQLLLQMWWKILPRHTCKAKWAYVVKTTEQEDEAEVADVNQETVAEEKEAEEDSGEISLHTMHGRSTGC